MATIKLDQFGGMRPLLDRRALPDSLAADAANVIIRSGTLRAMSQPSEIYRFSGEEYPTARRLRFNDGTSMFYPLTDLDSTIIKAPLVNDGFERFYILDPPGTPLRFNTKTRLLAGDPSYLLGLPAPSVAPTVGHTGGSATLKETRAYVYTYVDEFGQEGPPSEPTLHTAPIDATQWNISGLVTTVPDSSERPAISKKLYRTLVSDNGQVSYYFVANLTLAAATYTDSASNAQVSLSFALPSISYLAPPADLEGLILMPGGFMVGWEGRNLHMSESYRPWAWPAEYDLALEYKIVGCGVIDQTLAVATDGNPYAVTGNTAAAMTASKLDRFEPCLSRQSIASGIGAVFYSSANGLMAVNASGVTDITQDLIGRDRWVRSFGVNIFGAARTSAYYIAFNDSEQGLGFMISTRDPREGVIRLQNLFGFSSLWSDAGSDDVLGMYYDGNDSVVIRMTPRDAQNTDTPLVYSWLSKEFALAQPTNFSVIQVQADGTPLGSSANDVVAALEFAPGETPPIEVAEDIPPDEEPVGLENLYQPYIPFFTPEELHGRMEKAAMVGLTGIGRYGAYLAETQPKGTLPEAAIGPGWFGWPYWPGVNSQPGRPPSTELELPDGAYGRVRVYANRVQIFNELLQPNRQIRMPSGFRASVWQVVVISRVPIYSIHLATHGKELAVV